MARAKIPLNQLEIPVPSFGQAIRTEEERERAYAEEFGEEALAAQKAAWEQAHRCTCGSRYPKKSGRTWHKAACPMLNPRVY